MRFAPANQTTLDKIALITNIIQLVYPAKRCVHYFGTRSPLIDQIFMKIGMPIVTYSHLCVPSGYLLIEDDRFESHRRHAYYNHNNLRLLIVNQNADEDVQVARGCRRYKSFDRANGLHVFLLALRTAGEEILDARLYSIRNCTIMGEDMMRHFRIRPRPWRPDPERLVRVSSMQFMPFARCSEDDMLDGLETNIFRMAMPDARVRVTCYDTNKWSDMERDVEGDLLDIGLGGSWDVKVADLRADLSVPLMQTCAAFLVPKPNLLPEETFAFQPFTAGMWGMIFFVICLLSVLYKRMERSSRTSYATAFFHVYRTLFEIPSPTMRRSSSKLLYLGWSLATVLITTALSAGFTMILTTPRLATPTRTFADILEHDLRCYERENYITRILNNSYDEHLRQIARRIVYSEGDLSNGKRCYFGDVLDHKYVIPTENIPQADKEYLMLVPQCFGVYSFVILFKKGSPIKRLFDIVINQAREHGLIAAWMRGFRNRNSKLLQEYESYTSMFTFTVDLNYYSPLTLGEMQGVLFALAIGCFLSAVAFIWEMGRFNNCPKHSDTKSTKEILRVYRIRKYLDNF